MDDETRLALMSLWDAIRKLNANGQILVNAGQQLSQRVACLETALLETEEIDEDGNVITPRIQ